LPQNFEELDAFLAKVEGEEGADAKIGIKRDEKYNGDAWTDAKMGLAKKAVMTFTDLNRGPVTDAYLEPLGITWDDTIVRFLPTRIANAPTPPEAIRFVGSANPVDDGCLNSNDGLIKEVSFYYATPNFVPALIKALAGEADQAAFIKPTVTAWTGVAATGKKLETLELDWTTGDLLLNFEKTDFMFKGVAKSISFTVPKFNGIKFSRAFWVDNVAIVAPNGKTKVLAAGALEIEEKFADIEKELKEMLEHED